MHIQINTDSNIKGDNALTEQIEAAVRAALDRFSERITWVEVYCSDENSDKKFALDDMRCVMEARLTGLSPIAVTNQAATVAQAVEGAAGKLERSLESTLGRLDNR